MPNTLTNLAADIYKRADVVGRELVGIVPGVTINADASVRAAKGDTIRSAFTPAPVVNTSHTPAMTIPEGDDQTIGNKTFSINQVANVKIPWTGEEILHVNNGAGFNGIYEDQVTQAFRAISNTIEAYLANKLKEGASRAFGTAGTNPFASNIDGIAECRQILVDNGCPFNDGQVTLAINTIAGTKLRNNAQLQKVNESGNDSLLRQGQLLNLQGAMIKESAGIVTHTKGTGTGYLVNTGAGSVAIGATTIPVDTGSGTVVAGDILTSASDAVNKYVVGTALTGGNVVINEPGVRIAIPENNALTVGNNYTPNVMWHRSAVELVVRAPKMPEGGDAAVDRMTVQDPWSGLIFELALYKGYGKQMLDITTYYDAKVWKPAFVALLLG